MSSFPAQAARAGNPDLEPRWRLWLLRDCVLRFAPYGFHATWHHLMLNAGVSPYVDHDPDALGRAVEELAEARALWFAELRAFEARRHREKAAGRHERDPADRWLLVPQLLAGCPDHEKHPRERLGVVVGRLIAAYRTGDFAAPTCPACGTPRPYGTCPECGVLSWRPGFRRLPDTSTFPWRLTWYRQLRTGRTAGGGDAREFRAEFTPGHADPRFGTFQLYVRGEALGDATTTALHPHVADLRELATEAARPGRRPPRPLILGDTFDYLEVTLEATDDDLIFEVGVWSGCGNPPPWAPRPGTRRRLPVRRAEVLRAWAEAEPAFERLLPGVTRS
ncbi:hypothetical protein BJY16_003878 [Actinoplanes octamycinicus]|uniref:Uncharacterized protein n=1 Tax=Actinoplanes octamycinicus TaxID=135948 RepID=A0A7W7M817_9ACTN|nr:hypothetical protein [Actinoplanes octamycinicus]MBB4740419.1 hypothetical protein [Actinoplanes octamycinicus]GIE59679.1 hypothetical protein Aoc01nite_50810 [Actinoplanes octamycinicus]